MKPIESKKPLYNNASFIERYGMDRSGGESDESVDVEGMFLSLSQGKFIRMRPSVYSQDFPKEVHWDVRVVDGNEAVWSRSRKKAEIEHFSRGTVLFSSVYLHFFCRHQ